MWQNATDVGHEKVGGSHMQEMPKAKKMKWSEKTNPFKVGDKILFDWNGQILTGFVSDLDANGSVEIGYPTQDKYFAWVSWRQCKLLKKKPPLREFWVRRTELETNFVNPETVTIRPLPHYEPLWLHVREVRKKK